MKVDLKHPRAYDVIITDLDSSTNINNCISADDETGEYEVYTVPFCCKNGKFSTEKKKGNIKISFREYTCTETSPNPKPIFMTIGQLKKK